MTFYRFNQIADLITSRVNPGDTVLDRYVGLEHLDPESLKLRRWGTPSDVIGEKLHFWPGDIIYGKRRAYLRKLAVAEFEGICSAHAMVLRAKQDVILPEFLPFFMQSEMFSQRAVEISVGSLSPTINWSTLAIQEFPIPPLDEQRRITKLLWAFSGAQSALTETKEAATRLLPALIQDLTAHRPQWKKLLLGKIARIDIKKVPVEIGKKYRLCGVLGYGQGVFDNGIVDSKSTKYKYLHQLEVDQLILRKITAFESPIAIVTPEFDGGFASPEFPTFTLDKSQILPNFMGVLYKTQQFKQEMQTRCTGTLVRRMRLNPTALLKIPISLPPLDEQKEIVSKVDALMDGLISIEQHLNSTKKLGKLVLEQNLQRV